MEIIRNSINVCGLTDPEDLQGVADALLFQYAEAETLTIPESQPEMTGLYQIRVVVEKESSHPMKTPLGTALILDGKKKVELVCACRDEPDKARLVDLEVPFNVLLEPPVPVQIENITVYILDAYFSLLDARRIYSHLVYMISLKTPDILPVEDNRAAEGFSIMPGEDYTPVAESVYSQRASISKTHEETPSEEEIYPEENGEEQLVDMDSEYL